MKNLKLKFGTNFAIFVLFFALALIEAVQSQSWLKVVIFMLLGVISLWADSKEAKK